MVKIYMNKKIFIFIAIILTLIAIYLLVTSKSVKAPNTEAKHEKNPVIEIPKSKVPSKWQDNGIFKDYYEQAYEKLETLTLDEKIGQLFLISYPSSNPVEILQQNQFSGYLFFQKDFKGKTESQVKNMMANLQEVSKIPIFTAVDEEGGIVVRISSNPNLASSKFLSPMDLYEKRWIC